MAADKKEIEQKIEQVSFNDAISERYLAYALSTITSRSLPDVRDGLKPVHRRLLYAMYGLKLNPETGYKKCARVVGDVIGKYHPHGDTAVYDALVRLAQSFAVRYPLIDGQGNFGSVGGDGAAAMRYTESRLTPIAKELLNDIPNNTVDFIDTYDGEESEPKVMPAAFPNLLANGAEGIAVGMATSIPPHNLDELCEAAQLLIKKKSSTNEELLEIVQGPDFPTGGVIVETKESIRKAYETGRGSFRLRAKWEKEELSHGQYRIVISEVPFQVQTERLLEKMGVLLREKKLPLLAHFQDESTEIMRIVIEPKNRQVDANTLMESLFKLTELENRISVNLNVINTLGMPKVMNLKEILEEFVAFRDDVVSRRISNRLGQIAKRLEILGGLLVAYLNIDEVIRIIREEDEPKQIMIKRWNLTDLQAESILNLKLRNLRKLEEFEIKKENEALLKEQAELQSLLDDDKKRYRLISSELDNIRKKYGKSTELGARRTIFAKPPTAGVIDVEAFIEREPITVVCSKQGWIRAIKGHQVVPSEVKHKEGDEYRFAVKAKTTDKLLIFTTGGKFFTLPCSKLPSGRGFGEPIRVLVDIEPDQDICNIFTYEDKAKFILAASSGKGFVVSHKDCISSTKGGKQIMNVAKGKAIKALYLDPTQEHDHVAISSSSRKLLVFPLSEITELKKGQGVALQKYKGSERLVDITSFKLEEGLSWQMGGAEGRTRTEENISLWVGRRAGVGKSPPNGFPKNNKF